MKKLLLALFLLVSIKGFTQVDVQISKPFRVVDAATKLYFCHGKSVLGVKIDGDVIILQVFDTEKMTEVARKQYEDMPKKAMIEKVVDFKGKVLLFYSLWDKQNETEQLFYREIDSDKGVFLSKGELLLKYKGKIAGTLVNRGFFNFETADKFDFQFSHDSTKMLVQFKCVPEDKRSDLSADKIGLYVVNNNMEVISDKVVKMPYSDKKMDIIDYTIDSYGNAFILTNVFNDNTNRKQKKGEANYHIELLKLELGSSKVESYPVELKNKFIRNIWIYEGANKDIICAGYYFNDASQADIGKSFFSFKTDKHPSNGIFTFKFDNNGQIVDENIIEFPLEVLNQFENERTQKRNSKKDEEDQSEFNYLKLRRFFVQADGSFILVGEQNYVVEHTTTTSRGTSTTYTYYYNDMLIAKIDPSGKLDWMKKLPKRQTGRNGKGGMGFAYFNGNGEHYLVFLDNVKNKNLPVNKVPAEHQDGRGGFLTAYRVDDASGETKKFSLFDITDVKNMEVYQFSTNRILPSAANAFVIEFYKKKKEDIYIKVTMP
ncbi:MAG: hypothetical protein WCH34_13060 [Bacteroidota bacterium]